MIANNNVRRLTAATLLSTLLLAGCVTGPTPYQAAEGRHGYSSEDLADDLVRANFRGNVETSEDDVEHALFRRLVEIADERGAASFAIIETETECVTSLRTSPTTTCTYRQSADAMFPYHFGVYEVDSIWHASPQREFEATATIQLFPSPDCDGAPDCFATAEALNRVAETRS